MFRSPRTKLAVGLTSVGLLAALAIPLTSPAQAAPAAVVDPALPMSAELSETSRLADRRFVVTGDKAWALGTADGRIRPPASTPAARWAVSGSRT